MNEVEQSTNQNMTLKSNKINRPKERLTKKVKAW